MTTSHAIPAAAPEEVGRRDERWQIRIRGLQKSFGVHHVLRGLDLDLERGKINIIIGGSGQGKSVLMKLLMGLLKPDAGHIWVDGEDIVPLAEAQMVRIRRKFGMVFQISGLAPKRAPEMRKDRQQLLPPLR